MPTATTNRGTEINTDDKELKGKLSNIFFKGKKNFFIGVIDGVTVKGYMAKPRLGFTYNMTGKFSKDQKYNDWQFEFNSFKELSKENYGLEKYLVTECPGLSTARTRKLLEKFGSYALRKVRTAPEEVDECLGCGINVTRQMQGWAEKNIKEHPIKLKLYDIGLTKYRADKIIKELGHDCFEKIKKDCYVLIKIKGFGYQIVSDIADGLNIPQLDKGRIKFTIIHCIGNLSMQGHSCVTQEDLGIEVQKLLSVSNAHIKECVNEMLQSKDLYSSEHEFEFDGLTSNNHYREVFKDDNEEQLT